MPEDTKEHKPERARLHEQHTRTTCQGTYILAHFTRHCRSKKHQDALDAWSKEQFQKANPLWS